METSWLDERKRPLALAARELQWSLKSEKRQSFSIPFVSFTQSEEDGTRWKGHGRHVLWLWMMSARCLCCWPPQPQYLQAWDQFSIRSKAHSLFYSLPSTAPLPPHPSSHNPSSLDWYPLTMTFLHMQPSHDGAAGRNWSSADLWGFQLLRTASASVLCSCGFAATVRDGVQFQPPVDLRRCGPL